MSTDRPHTQHPPALPTPSPSKPTKTSATAVHGLHAHRDPRKTIETRLRAAFYRNVRLSNGTGTTALETNRFDAWISVLGDVSDADILCELAPVLRLLSVDSELRPLMLRDGLIPAIGSQSLHFQAIAARVASHHRAFIRAGNAPVTTLPLNTGRKTLHGPLTDQQRSDVKRLRTEILKLADAALAVEKERERLHNRLASLENRYAMLRGAVQNAVKAAVARPGSALKALADMAVHVDMKDAAKALRALPAPANAASLQDLPTHSTLSPTAAAATAAAHRDGPSPSAVEHPAVAALRNANRSGPGNAKPPGTGKRPRGRLRLGLGMPGQKGSGTTASNKHTIGPGLTLHGSRDAATPPKAPH